jgi:hypothetical protein
MQVRTIDGLTDAYERLFNQQRLGTIGTKAADALNARLRYASQRLMGALRLLQARKRLAKISASMKGLGLD